MVTRLFGFKSAADHESQDGPQIPAVTLVHTIDPSENDLEDAANEIGVSVGSIQSWFQNQFLKTSLLSSSDAVNPAAAAKKTGGLKRISSSASIASSSALPDQHPQHQQQQLMMVQQDGSISPYPLGSAAIVYLPASEVSGGLSQEQVQAKIAQGSFQPVLVYNNDQQHQQQQNMMMFNQQMMMNVNLAAAAVGSNNGFNTFDASTSTATMPGAIPVFPSANCSQSTLHLNTNLGGMYRDDQHHFLQQQLSSPDTPIDSVAMSDHETIMSGADENESLYSWSQYGGDNNDTLSDFSAPNTNPNRPFFANNHHGSHPYLNTLASTNSMNPIGSSFLPRVGSRENVRAMGAYRRVSSSIQLQRSLYPQMSMIPNMNAGAGVHSGASSSTAISSLHGGAGVDGLSSTSGGGMISSSQIMPTELEEVDPTCPQPPELEATCQPGFLNFFNFGGSSSRQPQLIPKAQQELQEPLLSSTPPSSVLSNQQLKSLSLPNLFALDLQGNMDRQQHLQHIQQRSGDDEDDEMDFDEFLSFGK